jgi:hypothetical protein
MQARRESLLRALPGTGDIQVIQLDSHRSGPPVIVIDNFLPSSVVAKAATTARDSWLWRSSHPEDWPSWGEFPSDKPGHAAPRDELGLFKPQQSAGSFPGIVTPLTKDYEDMLWAQLQRLDLEKLFDGWLSTSIEHKWNNAFYGLVCLSPSSLAPSHKIPHIDGVGGGKLALVHYINRWPAATSVVNGTDDASGGTAFYKETTTGLHEFGSHSCAQQSSPSSVHCIDSLAYNCTRGFASPETCEEANAPTTAKHRRSYFAARPSKTDLEYELLHVVSHRFNRAIIYTTTTLHNPYIDSAAIQKLSCDSAHGRLTTSVFIQ